MDRPFITELEIAAPPEIVYAYFLEPAKMVRWMGERAQLRAVAGGAFSVDINGVLIRGHYVTLDPSRQIVLAWGQLGNPAMPPGSTRVVIDLTPTRNGTHLRLSHSGLVPEEAEKHAMGWPHFLGRMRICAEGREPGVDPFSRQE